MERGVKRAWWLHKQSRVDHRQRITSGDDIRSGPQQCWWLRNPCRLEGTAHFRAEDKVKSGSNVGLQAT